MKANSSVLVSTDMGVYNLARRKGRRDEGSVVDGETVFFTSAFIVLLDTEISISVQLTLAIIESSKTPDCMFHATDYAREEMRDAPTAGSFSGTSENRKGRMICTDPKSQWLTSSVCDPEM